MHAVRRYQSVDLPENRLVKEFLTQLAELLELRREHLGQEDELLGAARALGLWRIVTESLPSQPRYSSQKRE